jgi:hypothetical protein
MEAVSSNYSFYSREAHIVSDDVAHPCEGDRDAIVFQLIDEA